MGKRHQVVIVGGGPVGVALAVDLGLRGISCGLVETRTGMHRIPKGQNLTHRTLEHFYFWGIVDELRAARFLPPGFAIGEITAYGDLMSPYWHAPAGREVVRDYYFQANDRLPQYQMEMVLRRKMASLPNVESRFGWSAKSIEQDDGGVRVVIANEGGNEQEVWEADYLVGCDGGHSLVRQQIGIERGGTDFDQLMVLVVFRSREFHEGLKRFPERSIYRVMHPDLQGYWKFFGRIDVGEGFFFHAPVPPGTRTDNFDFLGLLHEAAGFKFACEFDHLGFWDLRVAVAERYQVGRVFIAGDAAHSHPPYGGYGLNNGLEDSVNLGWKLAATVRGWGGPRLTASYETERRPIALRNTGHAKRLARNVGAVPVGDAIDLDTPAGEADRRAASEFLASFGPEFGSLGVQLGARYDGSPIVIGDGAAPPPDDPIVYTPSGVPGGRAPHLWLADRSSLYDRLGPGFTLLRFAGGGSEATALETAARRRGVPLTVLTIAHPQGRDLYGCDLALVRPDQHVAWRGNRLPEDNDALIRRVTGW